MKLLTRLFTGLLLSAILFSVFPSCHGSYTLFHKFHRWNGTIKNKWARSAVHFLFWVIPVYEICLLVDLVGLNTIEFWSGSNPLAMEEGEREEQIVQMKGETYRIVATQNRFDVTQLTGEKKGHHVSLVFNEEEKNWVIEAESQKHTIARIDEKNPKIMYLLHPSGAEEMVYVNELR